MERYIIAGTYMFIEYVNKDEDTHLQVEFTVQNNEVELTSQNNEVEFTSQNNEVEFTVLLNIILYSPQ